ncbi:hypothetical protein K491DRAFT_722613 [Lophiostoma macrostomum CBS 122681]|uniref:Uncharacterized protein n=1 Tax=Lophiostoma macrostomum CBS 122681 TaxID=1314788 RepID=A0A6A6SP81_9PLEO|nr:hypothetical protein K491DRAFT_722613 [Lophiostoma macrostomum CBS 122681]
MTPTQTNHGSAEDNGESQPRDGGRRTNRAGQTTKSPAEDTTRARNTHDSGVDDAVVDNVDETMTTIDDFMRRGVGVPQLCPWHRQQVMGTNAAVAGLSPMQRYMAETETEQSTVYYRALYGTLSIAKACTCGAALSAVMESTSSPDLVENNGQRH